MSEYPHIQAATGHPALCGPFFEALRDAIVGQTARAPPVVDLLGHRRPTAVARLVVAVVVDTVDRHTGWALAHVGEEVHEACLPGPSVAYSDTSAAIVFVGRGALVPATRVHVEPTVVRRRSVHPMRREAQGLLAALFASATVRSGPWLFDDPLSSANAAAIPTAVSGRPQGCPKAKTITRGNVTHGHLAGSFIAESMA